MSPSYLQQKPKPLTFRQNASNHQIRSRKHQPFSTYMKANEPVIPKASPSIFAIPENHHLYGSGFVHCIIHRGQGIKKNNDSPTANFVPSPRSTIPFKNNQRYTLSFQIGYDQTAIIVEKQLLATNPTYLFYDVTRSAGQYAHKLTKKSGHYIGSLQRMRNKSMRRSSGYNIPSSNNRNDKVHGGVVSYSLFNASEREKLATFTYELPSFAQQWKDGHPPRKFSILLPQADENGKAIPSKLEMTKNVTRLKTKEPSFDGVQYKLNFGGRVLTPSVKNMQIEFENGNGIVAQFGKIGEDSFHLDYK